MSDRTPVSEQERKALAAVYAYLLQRHEEKKAAGVTTTNGDDAKGSQHDRAKPILPRG